MGWVRGGCAWRVFNYELASYDMTPEFTMQHVFTLRFLLAWAGNDDICEAKSGLSKSSLYIIYERFSNELEQISVCRWPTSEVIDVLLLNPNAAQLT